jgi:hypothetical protein
MLNTLFIITSFLIPLFAFALGVWTIINSRSRIAVLWFLTSLAIGTWGLGLSILLLVKTPADAMFYNIVLYSGAVLIPAMFFHFTTAILLKEKFYKILIIIGYILAFIFLFLAFNPPWLIGGVASQTGFAFWENIGRLYIPFLIYFWVYAVLAIYLLYSGYKRSEGLQKRQIYFILLAGVIGYFGGGTNYLPQLFGIYPFGNFFTFLYPILMTYGIFLKKD